MKLYKLTDQHNCTRKNTEWGEYVTHSARDCENRRLCSDTVLHAYTDPILAVLLNPVHGSYNPVRLWEAEGEVVVFDSTKVGCIELTTIKEIPLPEISMEQKIKFAIFCVLEVYRGKSFVEWAQDWLGGKNRSYDAAINAANAAYDAAYAAHDAAYAYDVYTAANAAANAANAAAYAAVDTAINAANAVANAAVNAANAADYAKQNIDLIAIAKKAMNSTEE